MMAKGTTTLCIYNPSIFSLIYTLRFEKTSTKYWNMIWMPTLVEGQAREEMTLFEYRLHLHVYRLQWTADRVGSLVSCPRESCQSPPHTYSDNTTINYTCFKVCTNLSESHHYILQAIHRHCSNLSNKYTSDASRSV